MPEHTTAFEALKDLLDNQRLAVLSTQMESGPYASLVGFASSEDLRRLFFVTSRATQKFRNLAQQPQVAMLIDNRTHRIEDFASGVAVTAVGRAVEVRGDECAAAAERFLSRHAYLEHFVGSNSTAVCALDVAAYYLVSHFQNVVEMDVTQW